jgi:hypothetical protein
MPRESGSKSITHTFANRTSGAARRWFGWSVLMKVELSKHVHFLPGEQSYYRVSRQRDNAKRGSYWNG